MRPIFPRKEKNNVQRFKIISFKEIDEKNWSLKKAVLNLKVLTCPEWFKNRLGEVWVCLPKWNSALLIYSFHLELKNYSWPF